MDRIGPFDVLYELELWNLKHTVLRLWCTLLPHKILPTPLSDFSEFTKPPIYADLYVNRGIPIGPRCTFWCSIWARALKFETFCSETLMYPVTPKNITNATIWLFRVHKTPDICRFAYKLGYTNWTTSDLVMSYTGLSPQTRNILFWDSDVPSYPIKLNQCH